MKKFHVLLLPILVSVWHFSPASAWPQSFRAKVRGLADAEAVLPREAGARPGRRPDLRLTAFIPGGGRVRIHLDRERVFRVQPTFSDEAGEHPDPAAVRLLRGRVRRHNAQSPAAAAIYQEGGRFRLFLGFPAPGSGRRAAAYYQLSLPLEQHGGEPAAQVRRISRYAQALSLDGDFLTVPANAPRRAQPLARTAGRKVVELNLDADRAWYQAFGGSSNSKITAYVNQAESLYEEQLGLTFDIARQNVSTTLSFGTTSAETMLAAYRDYTAGKAYFDSADVHHLFTGVALADDVLGVAYLGTVCAYPEWAFLLSRSSADAYVPITFAHELGHSFGAVHDNSSPPSIMSPVLTVPPPQLFSQFSRSQIAAFVQANGSCLGAQPTPAPTRTPKPTAAPTRTPTPQPTRSPAPSRSPSPTPTRKPGGGQGGGSGGPPPIEMSLRATLSKKGVFRAQIGLQEQHSDCSVRLLASSRDRRIFMSGRTMFTFAPIGLQQQVSVQVPARLKKPQNLFVAAEIRCPDGSIGSSGPRPLQPYKIKTRKALTLAKWLTLLGLQLQQATIE